MTRTILFLGLLLSAPAIIAAQNPLNLGQVKTLLELGFAEDEVMRVLQRDGVRIEAHDVSKIDDKALPASIQRFLRDEARKQVQPSLSVQEVVALWRAGVTEAEILAKLNGTRLLSELSIEDVLVLVRAGIPDGIIRVLRCGDAPAVRRAAPAKEKVSVAAVLDMTARKVGPDEIIAAIRDSESTFDIEARDVLDLSRSGVDRAVLKEMYARRLVTPEVKEARPTAAAEADLVPSTGRLNLYRAEQGVFTMLAPAQLDMSKEFKGNRALVHWKQAAGGDTALPDIELSVLRLLPKEDDKAALAAQGLEPAAGRFMDAMKQKFESEGIQMLTKAPRNLWISDRAALAVECTAATKDGKAYVGSHLVVLGNTGLYLISYLCRAEQAAEWQPVLALCQKSFALGGGDNAAEADEERKLDAKDALQRLFGRYKSSLHRLDWNAWSRIHEPSAGDSVTAQVAFLKRAEEVTRKRQRLEIVELDPDAGRLVYAEFAPDDQRTLRELNVRKSDGLWRIHP